MSNTTNARWWEAAPIVDPSTMTPEQQRAVAQARQRRAEAEAAPSSERWREAAPVVQDANGQRYEGGVPVGGRTPLPPPGFVMEPQATPSAAPSIEVELPDGSIAEFPAGTSEDVMRAALRRRFPRRGRAALARSCRRRPAS